MEFPCEAISRIFEYLKYKDFKLAQVTSRQWLDTSQLEKFEDRTIVILTLNNDSVLELFEKSFRKFPNFHFRFIEKTKMSEIEQRLLNFFTSYKFSDLVTSLKIENFELLSYPKLMKITKLLPKLSYLEFINTDFDNPGDLSAIKRYINPTEIFKSCDYQEKDRNKDIEDDTMMCLNTSSIYGSDDSGTTRTDLPSNLSFDTEDSMSLRFLSSDTESSEQDLSRDESKSSDDKEEKKKLMSLQLVSCYSKSEPGTSTQDLPTDKINFSDKEENTIDEVKSPGKEQDTIDEVKSSDKEEDAIDGVKFSGKEEDKIDQSKSSDKEEDKIDGVKFPDKEVDKIDQSKFSDKEEDKINESKSSGKEEDKIDESKSSGKEQDKIDESKSSDKEEDKSALKSLNGSNGIGTSDLPTDELKSISIEETEMLLNLSSLSFHSLDDATCKQLNVFSNVRQLKNLYIEVNYGPQFCTAGEQKALCDIVRNNASSMRDLKLQVLYTNEILEQLIPITTLDLEEFSWRLLPNCTLILDFLKRQNRLTNLSLNSSMNTELASAIGNLPKLEKLSLQNCETSKETFNKINALANLRSLNLSYCKRWDGIDLFIERFNPKIEELKMTKIPIPESYIVELCINLPNLKVFHCGSQYLYDFGLQTIIRDCNNLIELDIHHSLMLTDHGVTGVSRNPTLPNGYKLDELEKLECLNLELCEISSQTIIQGLKFPNLKYLYLSEIKIQNGNVNSIRLFTRDCPKIKHLRIADCVGGNAFHKAIRIIMENLKELEKFTINRICKIADYNKISTLVRNRADLSIINLPCGCRNCLMIRQLCENFVAP